MGRCSALARLELDDVVPKSGHDQVELAYAVRLSCTLKCPEEKRLTSEKGISTSSYVHPRYCLDPPRLENHPQAECDLGLLSAPTRCRFRPTVRPNGDSLSLGPLGRISKRREPGRRPNHITIRALLEDWHFYTELADGSSSPLRNRARALAADWKKPWSPPAAIMRAPSPSKRVADASS